MNTNATRTFADYFVNGLGSNQTHLGPRRSSQCDVSVPSKAARPTETDETDEWVMIGQTTSQNDPWLVSCNPASTSIGAVIPRHTASITHAVSCRATESEPDRTKPEPSLHDAYVWNLALVRKAQALAEEIDMSQRALKAALDRAILVTKDVPDAVKQHSLSKPDDEAIEGVMSASSTGKVNIVSAPRTDNSTQQRYGNNSASYTPPSHQKQIHERMRARHGMFSPSPIS